MMLPWIDVFRLFHVLQKANLLDKPSWNTFVQETVEIIWADPEVENTSFRSIYMHYSSKFVIKLIQMTESQIPSHGLKKLHEIAATSISDEIKENKTKSACHKYDQLLEIIETSPQILTHFGPWEELLEEYSKESADKRWWKLGWQTHMLFPLLDTIANII
ncbi:hypothetical protein DENSPDRAFT_849876 [Dentipellis sp. KUC8613]|nr:hypothetical protein DENSPDRAFT_849876 [Dentipellis sp. KUC8613]